uniref:Uncharacterized protein n=1 Tax=Romanomermis culicivorax TaxID=13658 RepID=A0A915L6A1_ROMCU
MRNGQTLLKTSNLDRRFCVSYGPNSYGQPEIRMAAYAVMVLTATVNLKKGWPRTQTSSVYMFTTDRALRAASARSLRSKTSAKSLLACKALLFTCKSTFEHNGQC